MVEVKIIEAPCNMETEQNKAPLVIKCIDFRTGKATRDWLQNQGLSDGSYYLYASAGASGNPNVVENTAETKFSSVIAVDHKDCGYYKKNGDDSDGNHNNNLQHLKRSLLGQNPALKYKAHLLPVNDERHDCKATAIILGEPSIVMLTRKKLTDIGLDNDYDEIARPYSLSVNDESLWTDLEISLSLHHPAKIFLFDKDEQRINQLLEKIKEIALHIQVEPIFFDSGCLKPLPKIDIIC